MRTVLLIRLCDDTACHSQCVLWDLCIMHCLEMGPIVKYVHTTTLFGVTFKHTRVYFIFQFTKIMLQVTNSLIQTIKVFYVLMSKHKQQENETVYFALTLQISQKGNETSFSWETCLVLSLQHPNMDKIKKKKIMIQMLNVWLLSVSFNQYICYCIHLQTHHHFWGVLPIVFCFCFFI